MPQKAVHRDGRPIQAWKADDEAWSEARAASKSGDLLMPCCGVKATAKISPLGFRFFAHRSPPGNLCLWANESVEHERLKAAACRAATKLGFDAHTEVIAPDGSWRADCIIRDEAANPVFAIEMWLSRMRAGEIELRHAGLRAHLPMICWFLAPGTKITISQHSDRAIFKMPGEIAAAECFVADHVTRLLTGALVWRKANHPIKRQVPFRLVRYWHTCLVCNARFVHAPITLLLQNEAHSLQRPEGRWTEDLPFEAVRRALGSYAARTGNPTVKLSRSGRLSPVFICPTAECHYEIAGSHLKPDIAHLWPGRDTDGVVYLAVPPRPDIPSAMEGSWGVPLPELPPWVEPAPDISGWQSTVRTAKEAMDRQDHERWIKGEGKDLALRNASSTSRWEETKRAFGEARVKELRRAAAVALGSDEAADAWLDQPEPAMNGMMPRAYAMVHSDCLSAAEPLLETLKTRR